MSDFKQFADSVNKRLSTMSKNELYVVGYSLDRDSIYLTYLASFPEDSDPLFRTNTEHTCSTCRTFVKNFGNVVEIVDGQIRTIWDYPEYSFEYPYDSVAAALNNFVKSLPLTGIFRSTEKQYGNKLSRSLHEGAVETFHHFWGVVNDRHFVRSAQFERYSIGEIRGEFNTSVEVFTRGLNELSPSALETVVDLIDSSSLYRGEEHLRAITEFRALQNKHDALFVQSSKDARTFVYANATNPAARFRNTVIGTLIQDISDGVDLERAVASFESKVAPTNYRRSSALITPSMIASAMKTINELGIEDSLQRRLATISDLSVNDVLWVNTFTQSRMKDGIEGLLMEAAVTAPKAHHKRETEKISIVQFMKDILPGTGSIDLLVKNYHEPNFVTITTGQSPESSCLFKWNNPFGWSYNGGVTDSIREKVKRAGGSVTGKLRVSLNWFNFDDLDIHIYEPDGTKIWYGDKSPGRNYGRNGKPAAHGTLDVDMNAGGAQSRSAVENVTWDVVQDGEYRVVVNQFSQRESVDTGFTVETESNGVIENYTYGQIVRGDVEVGRMLVQNGVIVEFKPGKDIHGGSSSKTIWNVKTETFIPVNVVTYDPAHWGDQEIGNRHYLFMLDGCSTDQATRGIYVEFLRNDLNVHRKVFETLGSKTLIQPSEQQLSGVGFSSTQRNNIVARVAMNTGRRRLIDIQF